MCKIHWFKYKRINGKIVPGRGPMLYSKVINKKKPDRSLDIKTIFQDAVSGDDAEAYIKSARNAAGNDIEARKKANVDETC